MIRSFAIASLALALAGCNRAVAATPDPRNPAHCIAAFSYGAVWLRKGADLRAVIGVQARAAYEMAKLARDGRLEAGRGEGIELTKRYARDDDAMMALFEACGRAQDEDPVFKARQADFIQLARRATRQCQRDPECAVPAS